MPKIVKLLSLHKNEVLADGEPLPFAISGDIPIRIDADSRGIHVAFLPVLVERVEVDTSIE